MFCSERSWVLSRGTPGNVVIGWPSKTCLGGEMMDESPPNEFEGATRSRGQTRLCVPPRQRRDRTFCSVRLMSSVDLSPILASIGIMPILEER